MNPDVEYRPCYLAPADRLLIGKDGSAWICTRSGRWQKLKATPAHPKSKTLVVRPFLEGKRVVKSLARLVLNAFGVPAPMCSEVFYRDSDHNNCSFSNLTWAPRGTGNVTRAFDKGTPSFRRQLVGSDKTNAKLDDAKVEEMRALYRKGMVVREIAWKFKVNPGTASKAISGKQWSHLPNPCRLSRSKETISGRRLVVMRGSFHPRSKLTESDVLDIRELAASGWTTKMLAERFNVSKGNIKNIRQGKRWKHLISAPESLPPAH